MTQVVYTKSHVRVESVSRICPPRGISTDCTLHNLERDVTLKVLGPVPGTEFNVMVLLQPKREPGGKCHSRTMIHNEACETYRMNVHHVSLRQSDAEVRLEKE